MSGIISVRDESQPEKEIVDPERFEGLDLKGHLFAEGFFCKRCDIFEDEDQVTTDKPICESCGCAPGDHVLAEVVGK